MRYRIEVNLLGEQFNDAEPTTLYTDNRSEAEITFGFFLDAKVRPVRLFDGDELLKSAENGIRRGC